MKVYFYFWLQLVFPNCLSSRPADPTGRHFVTPRPLLAAPNATSNRNTPNQLPSFRNKVTSSASRQAWPLRKTNLNVQESRRDERHDGRSSEQHFIAAPLAFTDYEYADPFADVRAMGEDQFQRSHIINPKGKKKTRRGSGKKVHRYPKDAVPAEPASQESHPRRRYPDVSEDSDQFRPMDDLSDLDLTNIRPQPSNDYADEADPDYEDDGYGDEDDEDEDESRSRTFVASGTGPIPEDMRSDADDTPDVREAAADSFLGERERDADRSIELYKEQEAE